MSYAVQKVTTSGAGCGNTEQESYTRKTHTGTMGILLMAVGVDIDLSTKSNERHHKFPNLTSLFTPCVVLIEAECVVLL